MTFHIDWSRTVGVTPRPLLYPLVHTQRGGNNMVGHPVSSSSSSSPPSSSSSSSFASETGSARMLARGGRVTLAPVLDAVDEVDEDCPTPTPAKREHIPIPTRPLLPSASISALPTTRIPHTSHFSLPSSVSLYTISSPSPSSLGGTTSLDSFSTATFSTPSSPGLATPGLATPISLTFYQSDRGRQVSERTFGTSKTPTTSDEPTQDSGSEIPELDFADDSDSVTSPWVEAPRWMGSGLGWNRKGSGNTSGSDGYASESNGYASESNSYASESRNCTNLADTPLFGLNSLNFTSTTSSNSTSSTSIGGLHCEPTNAIASSSSQTPHDSSLDNTELTNDLSDTYTYTQTRHSRKYTRRVRSYSVGSYEAIFLGDEARASNTIYVSTRRRGAPDVVASPPGPDLTGLDWPTGSRLLATRRRAKDEELHRWEERRLWSGRSFGENLISSSRRWRGSDQEVPFALLVMELIEAWTALILFLVLVAPQILLMGRVPPIAEAIQRFTHQT